MFKEEYVFHKYKNRCFKNAERLKSELIRKYKDVDVGDLYMRIVNYQVKKYGTSLCYADWEIKQ